MRSEFVDGFHAMTITARWEPLAPYSSQASTDADVVEFCRMAAANIRNDAP